MSSMDKHTWRASPSDVALNDQDEGVATVGEYIRPQENLRIAPFKIFMAIGHDYKAFQGEGGRIADGKISPTFSESNMC
eukprot:832113-Amorphochlora_amoeboformis.AAC.3